jgi:hypothetical protein
VFKRIVELESAGMGPFEALGDGSAICLAAAWSACDREKRIFGLIRLSPRLFRWSRLCTTAFREPSSCFFAVGRPYENKGYALSEGKRLCIALLPAKVGMASGRAGRDGTGLS